MNQKFNKPCTSFDLSHRLLSLGKLLLWKYSDASLNLLYPCYPKICCIKENLLQLIISFAIAQIVKFTRYAYLFSSRISNLFKIRIKLRNICMLREKELNMIATIQLTVSQFFRLAIYMLPNNTESSCIRPTSGTEPYPNDNYKVLFVY